MRPVSIGANPVAATPTTLYTVPKGYYASLIRLHASNATASNKHITFSWYDSSAAATYNLTFEYAVNSKNFLDLDSNSSAIVVLEENDTLSVTTEAGSTYAVAVTFEIEGNQRA